MPSSDYEPPLGSFGLVSLDHLFPWSALSRLHLCDTLACDTHTKL